MDDEHDSSAGEQAPGESADITHIRAYLEQQRAIYHRDALRMQLLADGYARESIERAMAQVYGDAQAPSAPLGRRTNAAMLLALVGTVLLNGGLCVAGYRFAGNSAFITNAFGAALSLIAVGYFTHRRPAVARGIRWGCVIWVLIVAGLTVAVLASLEQWL